ncbi:MAG: ATP/GTP-binding protein [Bacteriovorax sp.]
MGEVKFIVITGGPGAGKTAILEMARRLLKEKATILPEAASIVFGGGFWRLPSITAKKSAQSAIYHVQDELEKLVIGEKRWTTVLCDRGSLDGLAYWPEEEGSFWEMNKSTLEKEYQRYSAVIHLRSPSDLLGYNHQNPLRVETAVEAKRIDKRIEEIWKKHPDYHIIDSAENFLTKAKMAIDIISEHAPGSFQKLL